MTTRCRPALLVAAVLLTFACRESARESVRESVRESAYELRTDVRLAGDGQSFLTVEVFSPRHERVSHLADLRMVPGNGTRSMSQRDDGPQVWVFVEYDSEGRGGWVTLRVVNGEKVLTESTRFVERPLPAGYVHAGIWKGVDEAQVIDRFSPMFSERPGRKRRSGLVLVEARINTSGTVDSVAVLNPSPTFEGLDIDAANAVKQWRFKPATMDGKPVAVAALQRFDFRLR